MNSLAVLFVLVGVAVAAPQAAYKPFAGPYKAAAYPYAAPGYPYSAPGYPYSAPGYPYAAPTYPYAAPGYPYSSPLIKSSPVKAYSTPEYYPQYTKPVAILRQSQEDNFDGSFTYDFEAENGVASQASGFVKNAGTEAESQVIQGQYSYISPEGKPIIAQYLADETGFHILGDHLPVAPADPYRIA